MKVVPIILLMTLGLVSSQVMVCPPDYCEKHPCLNQTSCTENETLAPTFCRCCFKCVPIIGEGHRCLKLSGTPPRYICDYGLKCCSGICRKHCPPAL
ncbi:fungal protease inhibitor-1-like [Cylas formicarius]|uniref:fungal protease inhibitor-1-like n=1 Tax=Cylas formicarius TaxID=197179 RepID=UPI002958A6DE|nr:fungal protease inhibitor-1-like [Cylas formicarius]